MLIYRNFILGDVQYGLKSYYNQILKNDFDDFLTLNNLVQKQENKTINVDEILDKIASYLTSESLPVNDIGLVTGRMGIVIFLFHYAKYSDRPLYQELAKTMLKDLINRLHANQSTFFHNGLYCIGWGIEYLYQNGFIESETTEILEQIDKKVMEINPINITDASLNNILGGIVHYVLARLYTINQEHKYNPFDEYFLNNLFLKTKVIVDSRIDNCDSIDIFIRFTTYYDSPNKIVEKPVIYDIISPKMPENYELENYPMGLNGNAGIGLALIFDKKFYE